AAEPEPVAPTAAPAAAAPAAKTSATPEAPAAPKSTGYLLPGETTAEIRTWALANGHTVSPKGRLPKAVLTAYRAANGEAPAAD
ncbi:hypothetical protein DLJ96_08720, partial [Actinotalea fermentans ATCC 43279 = JCM 9966 = DSM 3133]